MKLAADMMCLCCACRDNAQTIQNIIGALVVSAMFIGTSNASTVQPVVDTERTVFYRCQTAILQSSNLLLADMCYC
jgi:hypothetical protein